MKTFSQYMAEIFPGVKVQKISVDAGFSCPNRDGKIGTGGCIYCRNDSFSPAYCDAKESVTFQLEKGKNFFSRKYPEMKYLAYFQSYTGTYNKSLQELSDLYNQALSVKDVVGLVIGTRPDCLSSDTIDLLSAINKKKPVIIELGAETSFNSTLNFINRNHTWEDVVKTTHAISEKGIHCGLHLIAGLPGENDEMVLTTIDRAVELPIKSLKIHQLQVLHDTPLARKIKSGELSVKEYSVEEYLQLCARIVKRVPEDIAIERFLAQSPPELVISPSWGLKNYQFMSKLEQILKL